MTRKYDRKVRSLTEAFASATAESRRHHAEQDQRLARAMRGRRRFVAAHGRER